MATEITNTGRANAILLLGPTGSGKTPLGEMLQERGLDGMQCIHFDFGENLRQAVSGPVSTGIVTQQDIQFLRGVLQRGELLEDKDFPIAERILREFLQQHACDANVGVVMNGLPRHVGQAADVSSTIDVRAVICLNCSPQTVRERIRRDTGGDRAARIDDSLIEVENKLRIYAARTEPLIDFYRQQGATIHEIAVSSEMTADAMWWLLQR